MVVCVGSHEEVGCVPDLGENAADSLSVGVGGVIVVCQSLVRMRLIRWVRGGRGVVVG